MIAGGIGITAFIATVNELHRSGDSFELHYAVRSESDAAFRRYLECIDGVTIYDKSAGQRLSINDTLNRSKVNTHVYCCGPDRLMDAVRVSAKACDIDASNVHFEAFEVATGGQPFTAELALSNRTLEIDSEHSLLEVLQKAGFDVESSCEVGNCGTCRITHCGGVIEHRGTALLAKEQEREMLSCVSRGRGHISLEL